jgi:peptidoglycan/xylan/chitin deacetylase (PgdA/CDA1 family)
MRASRLVRHPLVIVPLVAALLVTAWIRYADDRDGLSQADPGANLFASVVEAVGKKAVTGGWQVHRSLDATASLRAVPGRIDDHALQVEVSRYVSGDVTLTSPRIPVSPQQDYLFKAYSSTGPAFTLLAHYFYQDGSDSLVALQDYPANRRSWSAVSAAFNSADNVSAVQYVFRLASSGTLEVDGAYLQPARDVHVAPTPAPAPNRIPNPSLEASRPGMPDRWSPYQSGWSTVGFDHLQDDTGNYLQTRIADYDGGEAKWQYPPIDVLADQYYRFGATYKSEQPVDVVAEFELSDGGRQFINLATVPPAGDWTRLTEHVQVPSAASTLMLTLVSHGNGTTAVRDYDLVDVSKPGAARWSRPVVSVAFDDGRASAYDRAVPLMDEYGYKGTFYVNPGNIEMKEFLTASELQALSRAGHDLAVHGYEDIDLTGISADRIDSQLVDGRNALAQVGLMPTHLAAPMGRSDAQVEWYARKYFQSMRGMDEGINTRQNLDPYNLKVFHVDSHTTPEALTAALTETRELHGWLILVYHEISAVRSDDAERDTISRKVFASQLETIHGSGIAVEPVSRAFAEVHSY